MEKHKQIILLLLFLLVITIAHVAFDYRDDNVENNQEELQLAAQQGYEQAIVQIIERAVTCEQVPLFISNQTINMIAVECLQQAEEFEI